MLTGMRIQRMLREGWRLSFYPPALNDAKSQFTCEGHDDCSDIGIEAPLTVIDKSINRVVKRLHEETRGKGRDDR